MMVSHILDIMMVSQYLVGFYGKKKIKFWIASLTSMTIILKIIPVILFMKLVLAFR
jgi:hypothetical protein